MTDRPSWTVKARVVTVLGRDRGEGGIFSRGGIFDRGGVFDQGSIFDRAEAKAVDGSAGKTKLLAKERDKKIEKLEKAAEKKRLKQEKKDVAAGGAPMNDVEKRMARQKASEAARKQVDEEDAEADDEADDEDEEKAP